MIENISKIEVKVGERSYQLLCDNSSPLGELHDVLLEMKALIIKKMQEAEKKDEDPHND